MKYWITSDTHFGHNKLIDIAGRPENFEELTLKRHHIKDIKNEDVVMHLGDVSFYDDDYWHKSFVNGFPEKTKKWLIKGNHERRTNSWYFKRGWDFVADKVFLNIYGLNILFSHIPKESGDDWDVNIHGHLHNKSRIPDFNLNGKHILISIEDHFSIYNLQKILGL